jgi:multidrug efflux pump subunit AcrA (membrane-fusion protein)
MTPRVRARLRSRGGLITLAGIALTIAGGFVVVGRGSAPDLPTALVARGEFVDTLELRGEIQPARSVVLSSPMQSGELQIIKLANNGAAVKAGDVLVEFDSTTLKRTIQEKQSELKQADAEIEQAKAQARITDEQNATALMKAKYDIERAKLDVNRGDTVSRIDNENAKLSLSDAQQRLSELEEKIRSDRTSAEADLSSKLRKREKALFDLKHADDGLRKLQLKAPTDGIVSVLSNYRAGSMMAPRPNSARAIARGPARRSSSCPTCLRCISRRVSTKPIAAGCRPARRRPSGSRPSPVASSRRESPASHCSPVWITGEPGHRRATSISICSCSRSIRAFVRG